MTIQGEIIPRAIQHVMAILLEDLPTNLRTMVRVSKNAPGLVNHLPCISVSTELRGARPAGLGHLVEIKQAKIEGATIELGDKLGNKGEILVTMRAWSLTLPQLESICLAIENITWVNRNREWIDANGKLNRSLFLRSQLWSESSPELVSMPPTPMMITINGSNVPLKSAPQSQASNLSTAQKNDLFELLGRSEDSLWVQGRSLEGRILWVSADQVNLPLPIAIIPLANDLPPASGNMCTPIKSTSLVVWKQDLHYTTYIEFTQEPLESASERITEVRLIQQIDASRHDDGTERMQIFSDHAKKTDSFPA